MPCRDEMSKRINFAFAVTERKENRTLREKSHFAGAKCFALRHLDNAILTAKQTIDNRLAGRAAKGASAGRSTGSLFRRYAPYCLNHGKSLETKGFQDFFLFQKPPQKSGLTTCLTTCGVFSVFMCLE